MLTSDIRAAMRQAQYEILPDNTFYGEIPGFDAFTLMRIRSKPVEKN